MKFQLFPVIPTVIASLLLLPTMDRIGSTVQSSTPIQPVEIAQGSDGAIVQGLFGRFPVSDTL